MESLEVAVKDGNLILRLPQKKGCERMIVLDFRIGNDPQLQFLADSAVLKVVNYHPSNDCWSPDNPAFPTFKQGSIEYEAFRKIDDERIALYQKIKS